MARPQRKTAAKAKALISSLAKSGALGRRGKYVAKLSAPMKKAVQKIVRGNEETKYHAEQLLSKSSLDWGIHTPWSPSSIGDTMPLVPRITPGDGNFERIGTRVRPTKCRVDVEAAIQEAATGLPQLSVYTNDIFVVMYILRPKTSKNFQQFTNLATPVSGAYTDELLDNGDGTSKAFGNVIAIGGTNYVYTNAADLQLPINKEYFTLVKQRVVRLVKNAGNTNQDGSNYPNVARGGSSWRGSFTYKLPALKYDDDPKSATLTGGYPTNANMVLCIGACLANGMDSIQYGGGEPTGILANPISLNVRTHYWYKDA